MGDGGARADRPVEAILLRGARRRRGEAAALLPQLVARAAPHAPAIQIAVQLLQACVVPRGDHLLRHLPPEVTARFGTQVDQLLWKLSRPWFPHPCRLPRPNRRIGLLGPVRL